MGNREGSKCCGKEHATFIGRKLERRRGEEGSVENILDSLDRSTSECSVYCFALACLCVGYKEARFKAVRNTKYFVGSP